MINDGLAIIVKALGVKLPSSLGGMSDVDIGVVVIRELDRRWEAKERQGQALRVEMRRLRGLERGGDDRLLTRS